MYTKKFEIRWSDIDANQHLGNSTYIDYLSHTRMSFFKEKGMGMEVMNTYGLGPVALYEHIYYFKEIQVGSPVIVSLELKGYSEDGRFLEIAHNFYDESGKNLAYSEMLFSWIDLKTRTLGEVPIELLKIIETFPKAKDFKILSKSDMRKHGKRPKDLS
ncbi:MAG: thioesterase family protein [Flavobacteriaceae bacterium]|nr:thioesterase family protein [Flavobacteriaceae bacterium]